MELPQSLPDSELSSNDLFDLVVHEFSGAKSVPLTTRLPQDLQRMVQTILSSRETPYLTESDFAREAVYRFVLIVQRALQLRHPALVTGLLLAQARSQADDLEVKTSQVVEASTQTGRYVRVLAAAGGRREAKEVVRAIEAQAKMADEIPLAYWRHKFLGTLFTNRDIVYGLSVAEELGVGISAEVRELKQEALLVVLLEQEDEEFEEEV